MDSSAPSRSCKPVCQNNVAMTTKDYPEKSYERCYGFGSNVRNYSLQWEQCETRVKGLKKINMLSKMCTLSRRICEPAPPQILGPTKQIKTQCTTLLWVNTAVLRVVYWGVEAVVLCFPAPIPREQCEDVIIFDNLKVSCQALATQGCVTGRKTSNKKQRALFSSAAVLYCTVCISLLHESYESHRVISTKYIFQFVELVTRNWLFIKQAHVLGPISGCYEAFSRIIWSSRRVWEMKNMS